MRKKLFLVKHEVVAKTVQEALRIGKGTVYEVVLAEEKSWPEDEKKVEGFTKIKK